MNHKSDSKSKQSIERQSPRKKNDDKEKNSSFKSQQSERILEIKQLYGKGVEVFGDRDGFDQWLIIENLPLGRIRPIDLLDTAVGIQMVMDELVRIEHGILA